MRDDHEQASPPIRLPAVATLVRGLVRARAAADYVRQGDDYHQFGGVDAPADQSDLLFATNLILGIIPKLLLPRCKGVR